MNRRRYFPFEDDPISALLVHFIVAGTVLLGLLALFGGWQ